MKIYLDSKLFLLGKNAPGSLIFQSSKTTLGEFLREVARRSPYAPELISRDGKTVMAGWEIEVNGVNIMGCPDGLQTVLKDGDSVRLTLQLVSGG